MNLEYRFGIIKYLEAALFSDMGNIWVLKNDDFGESASFEIGKLWKDLAIGTGIGLRLNFDYFVIRFDVAKRMKDPGAEDPYAIKFFYAEPPVYNFAIGYPF
jgi:outer membrane protein assembly factor BamA